MAGEHSTRGRSRLLQEMLRGEVIRDRWKSEVVKDALSLCLGCKGCRSDRPAVRAAQADTLIIADGYSCREQITQGTGRQPLHLAEVLRMAIRPEAPRPALIERTKQPAETS